jgi:hypothetical protein
MIVSRRIQVGNPFDLVVHHSILRDDGATEQPSNSAAVLEMEGLS